MSKIKDGGLDHYGAQCCEVQLSGATGPERVQELGLDIWRGC